MRAPLATAVRSSLLFSLLVGGLCAQVTLKRGAVTYTGSAHNTSAPATIDETKVRDATPEWQKIQSEGIDPGSAQGKQLVAQMNARIRDIVRSVAATEGRDLVVRQGDITDRQGRSVADITDKVVSQI